MKRLILLTLSLLIAAAALPVFAQDDEAIQRVSDAIAALQDLESYTIHTDQTDNSDMQMQIGEQTFPVLNEFISTNDIQMVKTADGYNLTAMLVQENRSNSAGQENGYILTFEVVAVDGVTYLRASDSSGVMSDMFPADWTNITADSDTNPMFTSLLGENFVQSVGIPFPIDATTVTTIEMLDSAEIEGEAVDVYQFQLSTDAILASHMFDTLFESVGGAEATGEGREQIDELFENAEMHFMASVGQSDGILRQFEMEIVITDAVLPSQNVEATISMQIEGTTTFSNFNEPVTIEVPEVE